MPNSAGSSARLLDHRPQAHHLAVCEAVELLGLLIHADNLAARVLRAHGLDLATVRAGLDQLIAQGLLPGPQPSDPGLLATLGLDLETILARLEESFGWEAYYYAAQNVRLRPTDAFPRAPGAGTPLICWRVFVFVREEAVARGEDVTPGHWLLALLRDAEDPVDVDLDCYPVERRKRAMLGLPTHGPSPGQTARRVPRTNPGPPSHSHAGEARPRPVTPAPWHTEEPF
jgi:hypothetical protein